MMHYDEILDRHASLLGDAFEDKLGRKLTEEERAALKMIRSGMMLEAIETSLQMRPESAPDVFDDAMHVAAQWAAKGNQQ